MNDKDNLTIRVLRPDEWENIAEVYEREFENGMPTKHAQSLFFGVFAGDDLVGFAHLETVFHLNAVYLEKEYRHRSRSRDIFNEIDKLIPEGFPLIILPDKDFSSLRKGYKMRDLGAMRVWRKDY